MTTIDSSERRRARIELALDRLEIELDDDARDDLVAAYLSRAAKLTRVPTGDSELSERERDVMIRYAMGQATKYIADSLGVGARTVETYRQRAMEKLQIKGRAAVVRVALERGWFGSSLPIS